MRQAMVGLHFQYNGTFGKDKIKQIKVTFSHINYHMFLNRTLSDW